MFELLECCKPVGFSIFQQPCAELLLQLLRPALPLPLAFFQVQNEVLPHAVELRQPSLRETPETLYTVDVHTVAVGEVHALVYPQMSVISHVNQAVVPPPAVCYDHAL